MYLTAKEAAEKTGCQGANGSPTRSRAPHRIHQSRKARENF
jgi:hypothetical protein